MPASAKQLVTDLTPHIRGKTILVLGASPSSLGHSFLEAIVSAEPKAFIIGGRSVEKIEAIKRDFPSIDTISLAIDMMSFESVRAAANTVLAMNEKIDVLVSSIGTMCTPWKKSEDGWESQLQSNHLGFFLFANLVIDKLVKDQTRVVNVSSEGYASGNGVRYKDPNFHDGEVYNPLWAYGQAKTGQILFASALARRFGDQGVLAYSIQPGFTPGTNLNAGWGDYTLSDMGLELKKLGMMAPGSRPPTPGTLDCNLANYVVAAFDPSIKDKNGAYIRAAEVVDPETMLPWAVGPVQENKCWRFSEECVGQQFR